MSQPNADPTARCPRCAPGAVCTDHRDRATPERPTAQSLLAIVARDAHMARGTGWLFSGGGNHANRPSHD